MAVRIILYSHSSRLGGAELAAPALAGQLGAELWSRAEAHAVVGRERRIEVQLLTATWDRRPRGTRELARAGWSVLRAQASLARSLMRANADVVVANNVQGMVHLAMGCILTRTPLVVYLRDLGRGGNRSSREVALYGFLLRHVAAGCISNSNLTRSSWDLGSLPTVVAPTAVPEQFFDRPRREREARVVMLGRIARWKGQSEVIRAADRAHGEHPLTLRLVGGALFDDDVPLPSHTVPVEFTGHTDRPWEELDEAALLVHASLTPEPFGQVLAQAAAARVPIVCAQRGGHMEWLEDGLSCLAADPKDEDALAAAMVAALSDPAAAEARAQRARERAEDFRESRAYEHLRPWITDLVERTSSRKSSNARSSSSET